MLMLPSLSLLLCTACNSIEHSSASNPIRADVPTLALRQPPGPPARTQPTARLAAESSGPNRDVWSDLVEAPSTVGNDLYNIFSTLDAWLLVGGAYLGDQFLEQSDLADNSNRYFRDHSVYSNDTSKFLKNLGTGPVVFAGAGAWYLYEDHLNSEEGLTESKKLLRSLASTGLSGLAFKLAANNDRPNGKRHGFPSGHASLTVAATTSLWHSYGPEIGVPAAIVSSLIMLQRLDSRYHDPGDIIGGAALGWMVATSIAQESPVRLFGAQVLPGVSPDGGPMVSLHWNR